MKLGLVVHDMGINALGRAYALSLLAESRGWEARAAGVSSSGHLWPVLEQTGFARKCVVARGSDELEAMAAWADVLIAVKLLPESFGVAARLARAHSKPLLLDIDDPDFEQRLGRSTNWADRHRAASEQRSLDGLAAQARKVPRIVSNPVLQRRWGGALVPHVRVPRALSDQQNASGDITVAFVGTNRRHKGIGVLRDSVALLATQGYRLLVTDDPPDDAQPWERWVGETSLTEGLRLIESADILAVPSLRSGYAPAQLPVKLIDAMMAGRAIVATRLEPAKWAIGRAGLLCRPGSVRDLAKRLGNLKDFGRRAELGRRARDRALTRFTPEAVGPAFEVAVQQAVATGSVGDE